jgi:hypothetical protein
MSTDEDTTSQRSPPPHISTPASTAVEKGELSTDKIFYTNKPKDIRDGLAAGVGNFLKGFIVNNASNLSFCLLCFILFTGSFGAAALIISAPIKGAIDGGSNGGALGAVRGFGVGLGMVSCFLI